MEELRSLIDERDALVKGSPELAASFAEFLEDLKEYRNTVAKGPPMESRHTRQSRFQTGSGTRSWSTRIKR